VKTSHNLFIPWFYLLSVPQSYFEVFTHHMSHITCHTLHVISLYFMLKVRFGDSLVQADSLLTRIFVSINHKEMASFFLQIHEFHVAIIISLKSFCILVLVPPTH